MAQLSRQAFEKIAPGQWGRQRMARGPGPRALSLHRRAKRARQFLGVPTLRPISSGRRRASVSVLSPPVVFLALCARASYAGTKYVLALLIFAGALLVRQLPCCN